MPAPGGYIWRGRPRLPVTVRAIRSAESVYGKPYPVCLSCGGPMVTSLVVPALHCAACGLGYQAGL